MQTADGQGATGPEDQQSISLNAISEQVSLSVEERVAERREFARQCIAILIVGSLFLIVILSFISLWSKKDGLDISDIVAVMEKLISPVVGIVGAVTGFYFGERQRDVTARATAATE